MTRTTHHSHPTPAFPVFCMAFTDDESLLLGGGGGASRTGIVNKLVCNLPLCISYFFGPYGLFCVE